jgi:hypothetical protein
MIFVGGIHGVGKTYFCEKIKKSLGFDYYTASQLIERQRGVRFDVDKKVVNINSNQVLLIEALNKLCESGKEFILDGHFCLVNNDGNISRVSFQTFKDIKPSRIILLTEDPQVIMQRRVERDGIKLNIKEIEIFQHEECSYAVEVAKKLGCPIIISSGVRELESIIKTMLMEA